MMPSTTTQPEANQHTPQTWAIWQENITQQQPTRTIHQQSIQTSSTSQSNEPHGHQLIIPKPPNTIRILLKNPNGIIKTHDRKTLDEWKELGDTALTQGYDVIGLPETNYAFTTNRTHNLLQHLKRQHRQAVISTSRCNEINNTEYQPGGTLTVAIGPLASRVHSKGQDKTHMGRWSYITIRRTTQPPLTIITAYRVPKAANPGDYTAHAQQMRQLRMAGYDHPNPREQCLTDLTSQIQHLQSHQHSIILLIDANEPHTERSGIGILLLTTKLINVIAVKCPEPPATHRRGSATIDIIAISQDLLPTVQRCGYLPFNEPPYAASDHRGGYIDLNTDQLLMGHTIQQAHNQPRILTSTQPKIVARYCSQLGKMCIQHNLLQRRDKLMQTIIWTKQEDEELETLDSEYTTLCIRAETRSKFPHAAPWHPRLHLAFNLTTYWRIRYSNHRTNTTSTKQLERLLDNISHARATSDRISPNSYPPKLLQQQGNIRLKLRMSYQFLKLVRQEAETERHNYLATEAELAVMDNVQGKARILKRIKQSEERRKTFKLLRLYIQNNNSSSVQEVQVPQNPGDDPKTTTIWKTVQNQTEVENHLHQYSQHHFAQADGSPFTVPPLSTLFGYSGLSPEADALLNGVRDIPNMSPTMKLILQSLERQAPPMPFSLPTDDELAQGYQRWPEKTSTSPSGRHLGHYKALLITPPTNQITHQRETIPRADLFHFIADLTRMAIQHCHTFGRWEVIWNILLQKTPGDSRIHRHRFLHLKEADDNLLTKKYIAKDLMRHAEQHNTIAEEAHGGRKGRQALDVAWMKTMLISQIHHEQKPACIFFNDLTSCYDRITENHSNMALRAHGCPTELLALHAQNQQRARYYIVSGYGPSTLFNQHTSSNPFHGSGQGAGDSPARWTIGSTGAINAYKQLAKPYNFCSPTGQVSPFYLAAFVDDTHNATEMPPNSTIGEMAAIIQRNTSIWEQLMHNISAKLELSKCTCYVYIWDTDSEGHSTPQNDPQINITVTESSTQQDLNIRISKLSDPYKLMGVNHTGDQNPQQEMASLMQRSNHYASKFSQSPIYGTYAELSYNCSYLPSIGYSLAVTSMTEHECYRIQQQAVNSFLPQMGYNRHFPRALTFLPRHFGGLHLIDLYTLQGMRHIFMIIRHLRKQTAIGHKFQITLDSYQLQTGLHQPVFINLHPIPYTTNPWISSTRDFLHHIDGQLHIHNTWVPQPLRENDTNLMQAAMAIYKTINTLQTINRCRMHLQVTFLSELVSPNGQFIEGAFCEQTNNTPLLHKHTTSKFTWPHQPSPGPKSCSQWRRFINTLKPMISKMGKWSNTYHTQRQWAAYHNHTTNQIYTTSPSHSPTYQINQVITTTRRKVLYTPTSATTIHIPDLSTPVIIQNNTSCLPALYTQPPKLAPAPTHWKDTLTTWQHQLFQDDNVDNNPNIHHPKDYQPLLTVHCTGYHQIHGTHFVTISCRDGMEIRYGGISPTPLGHSSTSRSTLSALYSSLLLIQKVWEHHDWTLPTSIQITIHETSTLPLIGKILQYQPHPLSPDYDLTSLISGWQRKYHHTNISVHNLNTQEDLLNPTPDETTLHQAPMATHHQNARKYHYIQLQPIPIPPCNLMNKVGLSLSGIPIPNRMEFKIHCASRSPDLAHYLLQKHPQWSHTTLDTIDWHPHGRALHNLPFHKRVTITKFIHGWLPLNSHMNKCDPNVPTNCPACQTHTETPTHFLHCKHSSRQDLRKTFTAELQAHFKQGKCEPTTSNLLLSGLFLWAHTPPTHPPSNISPAHQMAFHEQQTIGWDQLWYGRLSNKWAEIHEAYRESPLHPSRTDIKTDILHEELHTIPGRGHPHEIWVQILIRKIWSFALTTWTLRNEQQHQSDEQDPTTTSRLKTQIQAIYNSAHQLPTQDRDIVHTHPVQNILHRSRAQQQHWIMLNQHFIKTQHQAAQARAASNLQDIRKFFTSAKTTTKTGDTHTTSSPSPSEITQPNIRRMIQGRISFNNSADPSMFHPP